MMARGGGSDTAASQHYPPQTRSAVTPEPTDARRRIVIAANRHRASSGSAYTMSDLERCVSMCRRRGLVKPSIIEAAGFRP